MAPTIVTILFLGLKPDFSMRLKNSIRPKIEMSRKSIPMAYLFHRIAPMIMPTKTIPVSVLLINSLTILHYLIF